MRTLLLPALSLLTNIAFAAPIPLVEGKTLAEGSKAMTYGGRTQQVELDAKGADPASLSFRPDDREYSGWMLRLGKTLDLSTRRETDALELRVRHNGSKVFAGFIDGQGEEPGGGVQSRRPIVLPDTAKGWSTVRIPLWQFPTNGMRWDSRTKSLSGGRIDWTSIQEFRLSTDKGANTPAAGAEGIARFDIAAIRIVPGDSATRKPSIAGRELGSAPTDAALAEFFVDRSPVQSWEYTYGGSTDALVVDDASGRAALLYRGDDREYSGWTIHSPKSVDLTRHLSTGALEFRIRGTCGGELVVAGLLDDDSDGPGINTQARVGVNEYARVTKDWQDVSIPLSAFGKRGMWWDAKRAMEVDAAMDWSRIQEFRISSERGANRSCRDASGRFTVQIADIRIVPNGRKVWDAATHWKNFRSDAPDAIARDSGEISKLRVSDWSRHAGLSIDVASDGADRVLRAEVVDSSGELWVAGLHAPRGASRQYLPLGAFQRSMRQPEGARTDRRFDLERIRSFSVVAGGDLGRTHPAAPGLGNVRLANNAGEGTSIQGIPFIRSNLVGWRPGSCKRFLSAAPAKDYALLDSAGKAVLSGTLTTAGFWDASGDSLWLGDFSRWTRPGTYRLAVGPFLSEPFRIGEGVYDSLLSASVRAFHYQRVSALDPRTAGKWAHAAGHPDTALPVMLASNSPATWSAPGGWYDAGDYGKYVVNAGISASTLLLLQELFPASFADGSLNIPESGNKRGDLLDEVLWEMDWFERMQDKDGGVFFKIAGRTWSGFVLPEQDTVKRWVIGKSTASTLNFAACMAQASRLVRASDPKLAARWLAASRKAWAWAVRNPNVTAPAETGGSGGYNDDQFDDEFLWAAVEIWRASGKPSDRSEIASRLGNVRFTPAPFWAQMQDLALVSLALSGKDSLARWAASRIEGIADTIHASIEASTARIPMESFHWGSNSQLLNYALIQAASHRLSGKAQRLEDIQEMVDYTLGRNALATSFVTGFGARAPRHPHHRLVSGREAIPGFLSGGPNQARQDDLMRSPWGVLYPHREPARSWLDETGSYASNEICINWNASLAFAVGYIALEGRGK